MSFHKAYANIIPRLLYRQQSLFWKPAKGYAPTPRNRVKGGSYQVQRQPRRSEPGPDHHMRPRPRCQPTPYTSLTRTTSYPRIVLKVGAIRYSRRHRGRPLIYKTLHATERFRISPIRPSGASLRPSRAMTSHSEPSTAAVAEMLIWEAETAIRSPPSRPTRRIITSALPESYGPTPQNRVKGGSYQV
jgi:hypothetical protein